jgi:CheY-like chemotaxis protein
VEDEEAVRHTLRDCLRRYGYRVLEASCGPEALAIASEHRGPLHLMVVDVVMPNMPGWQVADTVCATRAETKVLFMSGYAEKAVTNRGALPMREGFLQKPFTLRALALKVRQILGNMQASATAKS